MRSLPHPSVDDLDLAQLLHALSDPVRLELVRRIVTDSEVTCSPGGLGVAKSTLSHHWRVLRENGVTHTRIEGKTRWVTLRRDDIDARFPGLFDGLVKAILRLEPIALPRAE